MMQEGVVKTFVFYNPFGIGKMVETDTKPPVRRTKVRPGWFLFVAKKYKLIEKTRLSSFYLASKKGSFLQFRHFLHFRG